MKDRIIYLDYVRIIACLMVLMLHISISEELASQHSFFVGLKTFLTGPCVPLFFMVSGALLLPCNNELSTGQFLRKRLKHVIFPTIFFTFLYIVLSYSRLGWIGVMKSILSMPFTVQGQVILWFIYPLIGLYLLTPIISPWLRTVSKRTLQFYLLLWLVTLLYPLIGMFLEVGDNQPTNILFYFSGYAGFFLLGYYMNKYPVSLKWLVPFAILVPFIHFGIKYSDIPAPNWQDFLNFPVAIMTAAWFGIIKFFCRNCKNESPKVIKLSTLTFGVYLLHCFVIRLCLWMFNMPILNQINNYYLLVFMVFAVSTVISFFIVWLISKFPFSKYIIGS